MSKYGAYNAGLPCKNSACKSHGSPHPNCQCYPSLMAEGGEIESFCSGDNEHLPGCEYFKAPSDPHHDIAGFLAHEGLHGLLKMHTHEPEEAMDKYHASVKKGHKKFDKHLDSAFEGKSEADEDLSKAHEAIKDWIDRGGIDHDMRHEHYKLNEVQSFAGGGSVKKLPDGVLGHPIENEKQDHNVLLNMVKGRASNYLHSLKPQEHLPKLAFDDAPDQTQQKKTYHRAVETAAHPLGILKKAGNGTIEPEDLKHFNNIHPELNEVMQKKLTDKILMMQLEGKKPSYKVRQGLSMVMGAPLSGEMLPANIQAAQAVFQAQGSPAQPGSPSQGNAPKKTSALAKASQSLLTADQAAASRQQKQ